MTPAPPRTAEHAAKSAARERELFRSQVERIHRQTDRLFALLMLLTWIAGIGAALWISPREWAGANSSMHLHVWAAVVLGAAIISFPIFLTLTQPARRLTRHVVAIGQMLISALLIHLTGGRIETHFHVFGSLAMLAFYRDWRVLITATIVVVVDHGLRGMFWPQSVYGVLSASMWRTVEHAGWVVFCDIFLTWACVRGMREMREIARRQVKLEQIGHVAQAATQAKSEFLANISHEIRTPMTAIMGYADLLLDDRQSAEDRHNCVQIIRRNGQHLLTIINDILDISKIEAGHMDVHRVACAPADVITEVVALLRLKAEAKNLELTLEYCRPMPRCIHTDPVRLRQILLNVIGNALKFTEAGSVRVRVDVIQPPNRASSMLQVEVIDTGIGMSAEQMTQLFQPFFQGDGSTSRRFGGTGLGLTISHRLTEMLGGSIRVASTPRRGSCFTVLIDAGAPDSAEMIDPAREDLPLRPDSRWRGDADRPLKGVRVLLAEDGPDNQRLISFHLRRAGADVVVAANGEAAVNIALETPALASDGGEPNHPFDVVLMDIQMPLLDGYAAATRLRARGYTGIVIALTAHALEDDRQRCLQAGCDEYATKPVSAPALINTIVRMLSTRAEVA